MAELNAPVVDPSHQETVEGLSATIVSLNNFALSSSDGSVPEALEKDLEKLKAEANDLQFKMASLRTKIQEYKDEGGKVAQTRFARTVVKGYLARVVGG
jgi:hypothetical protein